MLSPVAELELQQTPPREQRAAGTWLSVLSHLDPKYGGLSAVIPELAQSLSADRLFDVRVEAFCLPDEQYRPATCRDLPLRFWPVSRKRWLMEPSLRRAFRQRVAEADGVHIHGLWEQSALVAARAARRLGKPYILSAHGMLEPWALAHSRAKKQLYSALVERGNVAGAACLHALTQAEARNYRAYGSRRPIAVIPNGVEVPRTLSPELFFESFPSAQGKRLVLFLGRLHRKKGVLLLVRAWQQVAAQWPEACLVLAGPSEDNTRATAEALANELGIGDRILFTGMLGPAMKWSALAAAECFVLPSYSEGLSVSALEAMGAGVPVVVTHQCNLPEAAEHQAGWQVGADIDELAGALQACLHNTPAANQRMGQNGAALVRARYRWPVVAAQMAELYGWAQGGPAPKSFAMQMA